MMINTEVEVVEEEEASEAAEAEEAIMMADIEVEEAEETIT
jgi:hypothetical protein